jgi:hypothetical protein
MESKNNRDLLLIQTAGDPKPEGLWLEIFLRNRVLRALVLPVNR